MELAGHDLIRPAVEKKVAPLDHERMVGGPGGAQGDRPDDRQNETALQHAVHVVSVFSRS